MVNSNESQEKRVNIGLKEKIDAQAKIISTLKKIPLNKFLEKAIEDAVEKDKHLIAISAVRFFLISLSDFSHRYV